MAEAARRRRLPPGLRHDLLGGAFMFAVDVVAPLAAYYLLRANRLRVQRQRRTLLVRLAVVWGIGGLVGAAGSLAITQVALHRSGAMRMVFKPV